MHSWWRLVTAYLRRRGVERRVKPADTARRAFDDAVASATSTQEHLRKLAAGEGAPLPLEELTGEGRPCRRRKQQS